MNVNDKVYCLKNEIIGTIHSEIPVLGGILYNVMFDDNKLGKFYSKLLKREFLTIEQISEIFANKELEQLVLKYKN